MLAPPGELAPPPRGNPGSATGPYCFFTVADPGFPGRGGVLTPKFGPKTYNLEDSCQKLHENERNWTWGAHVPGTPLDPQMLYEKLGILRSERIPHASLHGLLL